MLLVNEFSENIEEENVLSFSFLEKSDILYSGAKVKWLLNIPDRNSSHCSNFAKAKLVAKLAVILTENKLFSILI